MVWRFIQYYHICRYTKTPRNRYNVLLKSLPILSCLRTNDSLDVITDLSISNVYNAILIVVDCLAKKKYYIPYTINKNGTPTEATALFLLQNI